jgi:hypothetical protein
MITLLSATPTHRVVYIRISHCNRNLDLAVENIMVGNIAKVPITLWRLRLAVQLLVEGSVVGK